ncbi:copper homeostasis protein CutC [Klenkia taihuensis]|uniref:PF03932 family protein CutC n=1 Tax=Klenkia taihuensis TaxID=1225127 RepID=A0A1I1SLB0_9ACTN|nr:copper homeostasis protein CutC [Klenkia taihuensis]GHE13354.1 copper homeostasis protein CutC [Klenkia taihuensis]SFD47191.1 copper homeostasis protein [Klenkia taihuensis]
MPATSRTRRAAVEICVDDVEGALAASAVGADRVELCAALGEGGVTPSAGTLAALAQRAPALAVTVLVRPRGGDFVHSPVELEVVCADVAAARRIVPVAGVAVGPLNPRGRVDRAALDAVVRAAGSAPVTFHRAFDTVADQPAALEDLVEAGVTRVLTSGGAATAHEGTAALRALVEQAAGRIEVMAGGGVRAENVAELVGATGVPAVHLRAARTVRSLGHRSPTAVSYDDGTRTLTSTEEVAAVVAALTAPTA